MALSSRMNILLESENCYDTIFVVGEGETQERIVGISYLFVAASPVFQDFPDSRIAGLANRERDSSGKEIVRLPDVEPATFKAIKSYVYTDTMDVNAIDIADVIKVADMFELSDLFDELKRLVHEYHRGTQYDIYHGFDMHELEIGRHSAEDTLDFSLRFLKTLWHLVSPLCQDVCQIALEHVAEHAELLVLESRAEFLSEDVFNEILQLGDKLSVPEATLADFMYQWETAELHRRNQPPSDKSVRQLLGDRVYQVRFKQMNHQDFLKMDKILSMDGEDAQFMLNWFMKRGNTPKRLDSNPRSGRRRFLQSIGQFETIDGLLRPTFYARWSTQKVLRPGYGSHRHLFKCQCGLVNELKNVQYLYCYKAKHSHSARCSCRRDYINCLICARINMKYGPELRCAFEPQIAFLCDCGAEC